MARPRLLDLFCGAGGAGMGYYYAGFDVVGVDIEPQPNYPFEFHQADALDYSAAGFDAIHASPPCQAHSTLRKMEQNKARAYPDLIPAARDKLREAGVPYAIENVQGAELLNPLLLCGSMFGLVTEEFELRRHRLFESNVVLAQPQCRHSKRTVVGFYGDHARVRKRVNGSKDRGTDILGADKMRLVEELMGITWMAWEESNQSIPPAYTEYVGRSLLAQCA